MTDGGEGIRGQQAKDKPEDLLKLNMTADELPSPATGSMLYHSSVIQPKFVLKLSYHIACMLL